MRKALLFFAMLCVVPMMAGQAITENRVEVKVTSEPIAYKTICDKAGGLSLEFDSGTKIEAGDRITIDVDYSSPTDHVSICRSIDLEISNGGSGIEFTALDLDPAGVNPTSSLYYVDDSTGTQNDLSDDGFGNGIFFHVYAMEGAQRITIDVLGTGSLTVGRDPGDRLTLVIFDQKSNDDFILDGIWRDPDHDGSYDVAAIASDNTLCVDISQWGQSTVNGHMDSLKDKLTFIASNPQIAHIASQPYRAFQYCKMATEGHISCGSGEGQAADTCRYFDYETGDGYISNMGDRTDRVIIGGQTALPTVEYQIKLEILVNGLPGDNGIYWSNQPVLTDAYSSNPTACGDTLDAADVVGNQASYIYRTATGDVAVPDAPHTPAAGSCDVTGSARAVSLTTYAPSDLGLTGGRKYLMIDLPAFNYDIGDITANDVVEVRVTLIKAPCGIIFEGVMAVGTMCEEQIVPEPTTTTMVFPYFTSMANDQWWDGLAITNLDNAESHFTALVYEQDGDVGAFTGHVAAKGIYVSTLEAELAGSYHVFGTGVLGDSLCYILICTDFTADGFAFMGSLSSNSLMGNESMGYLPRVDYYNATGSISFCQDLGVPPGVIPYQVKPYSSFH